MARAAYDASFAKFVAYRDSRLSENQRIIRDMFDGFRFPNLVSPSLGIVWEWFGDLHRRVI